MALSEEEQRIAYRRAAVKWHDMMDDLILIGGFTRQEAFELVKEHWAIWHQMNCDYMLETRLDQQQEELT